MHPIVYDVAVSLDGFISGPSEDISKFTFDGPVVDDYNSRLQNYSVAILGRTTYEFGYQYGLKPGENPYKHMKCFVFSKSLECPDNSEITVVRSFSDFDFDHLKQTSNGPIYLCGGGELAGSLLEAQQIDRVLLKRTPIVLGGGVQLFGFAQSTPKVTRANVKIYDSGHILEEFEF